jgi:hypothetical protein
MNITKATMTTLLAAAAVAVATGTASADTNRGASDAPRTIRLGEESEATAVGLFDPAGASREQLDYCNGANLTSIAGLAVGALVGGVAGSGIGMVPGSIIGALVGINQGYAAPLPGTPDTGSAALARCGTGNLKP